MNRYCGLCHTCGSKLRRVLDGEEWCDTCNEYRRYRSHGFVGDRDSEIHCPDTVQILADATERRLRTEPSLLPFTGPHGSWSAATGVTSDAILCDEADSELLRRGVLKPDRRRHGRGLGVLPDHLRVSRSWYHRATAASPLREQLRME